jgi:hypothetical protein
MAGGIFEGRPFAFNIKCIVFTLIVAGGYWYAPPKNVWVLLLTMWAPYVAMAWYDYMYECKDKMQPTIVPFGRYIFLPFKPPGYRREYERMAASQHAQMRRVDHAIAWVLVVGIAFWATMVGARP